jgi:hypothetical protein
MRKNIHHIAKGFKGFKRFRLRWRWVLIWREYVAMSAIWFDDGHEHWGQPFNIKSGFVITGKRHDNCYATKSALSGGLGPSEVRMPSGDIVNLARLTGPRRIIQGFVTSKNIFLSREEAAVLAYRCGQILWWKEGDPLTSEEIY